MNRYTTEWWEDVLDLKVPEQDSGRRWLYWFMAVCLIAIVISNSYALITADSPGEVVYPVSQVVFWVFFAGAIVGPEGIFLVASVRTGERTRRIGRKLRVVCLIALIVYFPFHAAAIGGNFVVEPGGYRWTSGLLTGVFIGLAFTLTCCVIIYIGYRRRREQA